MGTLTVEECTAKHSLNDDQAEALSLLNNPLTGSRTARQTEWFERLDLCLEVGVSTALIAEVSGKPVSWIDRDVLRARTRGYCRHAPAAGERHGTTAEVPAAANGETQDDDGISPDGHVADAVEGLGQPIRAEAPGPDSGPPPPPFRLGCRGALGTARCAIGTANAASERTGRRSERHGTRAGRT